MDDEFENELRADPLLKKIAERDIRLAELVLLEGRIIAMQTLLQRAKRNGLEFAEIDKYLMLMDGGSQSVVAAMNKRFAELQQDGTEIP
jgi:hypothetical protein